MGERDAAAGVRDVCGPREEISPQREAALLEAVLRHQVGIDPSLVGPVLDLAAVGIVNSAWRNSPVEDWHAGDGPLTDGDMLRVNAHTAWRVREVMRRWRAEMGLTARSPMAAVHGLNPDHVEWLAVRIFRWLVNPGRRLPTGVTLADLAGADLDEFTEHVDGTLGGFAATAERRGPRFALHRAAAHGGLACPHWWGTPTWPALVGTFARFSTTRLIRTGGRTGTCAAGFDPRRRRSPIGLGCGDCSSYGPGISNRGRPSGSSTPAWDTSVRHYRRYPTTWCFRHSRLSEVGLASRTGGQVAAGVASTLGSVLRLRWCTVGRCPASRWRWRRRGG